MGGDRVDVLLDEAGPVEPGPERGRDRRALALRALRRWWPAPVVLVAALVTGHLVAEQRAEAAAERLRGVDGVLASTVRPGLTARPWATPRAGMLVAQATRTTGGLLTLPWAGEAGAWDVVAVDARTGAEAWRAHLVDAAPDGAVRDVSCTADADPATTLACTAVTGVGDWRGWAAQLLRVDLADGAVTPLRDLPPGASAVVVDGAVVLVEPAVGSLVVTATDLGTGAALPWRLELPDPVADDGTRPWVEVVDGHVWVAGGRSTWSLAGATGVLEGSGTSLFAARGGRVVDAPGSSASRVLADGQGVRTEGTPETVYPDDGSEPDLLLLRRYDGTSPTGFLRAVDAVTGVTAWERPLAVDVGSGLVVLDGVVYGAEGGTVWAVDLATGADRWTSAGGRGVGAPLLSDGRALLRGERDPEDGTPLLVAYGLGDGRRLWETPLPEGVEALRSDGGILRGWGEDSVWVVE